MTVYIYALIDPRNEACRYIGKTVNPKLRIHGHVFKSDCNKHKERWIGQLRQLGLKPRMDIIETIHDSDDMDWQAREIFWIAKKRAGGCDLTNLSGGGIGGGIVSEETKKKLAFINTGKKASPEAREKMSRARKGIKHSKAHSEAIGRANTGRVYSEETKRKISIGNKGKKISEATRDKLRIAKAKRTPLPKEHYERLSRLFSGKPMSQERRAKLTGRKFSEDHRARISAGKLGKKNSAELRIKMSLARKGIPKSESTKQRMRAAWAVRRMQNHVPSDLSDLSVEYIAAA